MTLTNATESKLTVASVTRDLADLEAHYRSRKKKLKALLAVLVDEQAAKPDDAAEGRVTDDKDE